MRQVAQLRRWIQSVSVIKTATPVFALSGSKWERHPFTIFEFRQDTSMIVTFHFYWQQKSSTYLMWYIRRWTEPYDISGWWKYNELALKCPSFENESLYKLCFLQSSVSQDVMVFVPLSVFHCMIICSAKMDLNKFLSFIAIVYLGTIGKSFLGAQTKQIMTKKWK